jgi:hypothetical protein
MQVFDSPNDGIDRNIVGASSKYEFRSIAIGEDATNIYVVLNGSMPLAGVEAPTAEDGNIGWGDLFFNFAPASGFNAANATANLFAVRFSPTNDSGAPSTGVYAGVTAKNVTTVNSGFSSLSQYNQTIQALGGTPSFGGLDATTPYFDQTGPIFNEIGSGSKIGDIQYLTTPDLDRLHAPQTGDRTQDIGFSFDKHLLPIGQFIANVFAECANDGVAIQGETQSAKQVPESSTLPGLEVMGLLLGGYVFKRCSLK